MFYNALGYAVEQGHLPANPIDRIQWSTPPLPRASTGGSWSGPAQGRKLLAMVQGLSDRGQHLEAFYACLYYAALRPWEPVIAMTVLGHPARVARRD